MKATAPPEVLVELQLLADIDAVLHEGESLSDFVEESVRKVDRFRQPQNEFHANGDAS